MMEATPKPIRHLLQEPTRGWSIDSSECSVRDRRARLINRQDAALM